MKCDTNFLIFCKAPIPGTVKTRLFDVLSAQQAADLHQQLARETIEKVYNSKLAPIQVWCSPDQDHALFQQFRKDYSAILKTQQGDDLGKRMQFALQSVLLESARVILIGTDCPSLTGTDFRMALEKLETGNDVVLAPAEDGGFTLIALRQFHARIFDQVNWGSSEVYQQTLRNISNLDLRLYELPMHWDLDRPADLQRYRSGQESGL